MSHRDVFIAFAQRDLALTAEQAAEEFDANLSRCGNRDDYLWLSRVGSSFLMPRSKRSGVWESYQNAKNHATFC